MGRSKDSRELTEGLGSPDRRRFLSAAGRYGFTTAVIAATGGLLTSTSALAAVSREEQQRQRTAKYTMNLATAYIVGASRSYPIMQLNLKDNIENMTRGKVYVKLAPGGQLGTGTALVNKVQSGTIQGAQHSLSNFAPFAPEADLINLPYWCGASQQFVNLVTSKTWQDTINPKLESHGFKSLMYVVIDPRVIALRKGGNGPIKTPDQMHGIKFRVPGSEILQKVYKLMGANPTPIAWGETTAAIKEGVADALDPSVNALYVFGFKDVLSWVTFDEAVPDAQIYSCNLKWFKSLPGDVQQGIEQAGDITFRQNLAQVPASRAYAMQELQKAGVQFYTPNDHEMAQWKASCGHQLKTWDDTKKKLAGSLDKFDEFVAATHKQGTYYVADV
ncbi:MAG: TRAP transporter substrate-binding protein [Salinisphaera sp.]|jgi:TRAP-type C4-dicarboxylate transport system substrate-binding protein|nr:TRAP transporter substrate-binding protein [Salinisphaera sp.]